MANAWLYYTVTI